MAPNEEWAEELLKVGRELYADEEARTRDNWQRADMLLRAFALLAAGIVWLVGQTTAKMVAEFFSIESFVPVLLAALGVGFLVAVAWHLAPVLGKPALRDTPSEPEEMLQHFDDTLAYYYSKPLDEDAAGDTEAREKVHRSAIAQCRQHYGRQYFGSAQKNRRVNDWQVERLLSGRSRLVWAAFFAALAFGVDQGRATVSGSTRDEAAKHDGR